MIKMTFEMVILSFIVAACLAVAFSIMFVHLWPVFLVISVGIWYYKHTHPKAVVTRCPDCELKEMTTKCQHHQ